MPIIMVNYQVICYLMESVMRILHFITFNWIRDIAGQQYTG